MIGGEVEVWRLRLALNIAAQLVQRDGVRFLPAFEALEAQLDSHCRQQATLARVQKIVAQDHTATLEGDQRQRLSPTR